MGDLALVPPALEASPHLRMSGLYALFPPVDVWVSGLGVRDANQAHYVKFGSMRSSSPRNLRTDVLPQRSASYPATQPPTRDPLVDCGHSVVALEAFIGVSVPGIFTNPG
jgi:hypothetical protein